MSLLVSKPWDDYITRFGDAATLYGPDGLAVLRDTKVAISNARFISMLGTSRGEIALVQFPAVWDDTPLTVLPSQIVYIPTVALQWFVVVKAMIRSHPGNVLAATLCSLMPLPLVLTVRDYQPVPYNTLNPYGEPQAANSSGQPVIPTQEDHSIRCALSHQFDPLNNNPEGDLPASLETIVAPLLSDVEKGDEIFLPGGRATTVSQTNQLFADGVPYALQMILMGSATSGSSPV